MGRLVALALSVSVACSSPELLVIRSTDLEPARPSDGYTAWTPRGEVIFVSSTTGDDANDGRSAETPFRTLARGIVDLRDGAGDWMLLRRGDVFQEALGTWTRSGSSASSPLVIGAYGGGADRPVIDSGATSALVVPDGADVQYFVLSGLTFYAGARDPALVTPVLEGEPAIQWLGNGGTFTVEDCAFLHYMTAMYINPTAGELHSVVVRRSSVVRSYAPDGAFPRGNGVFVEDVSGLIIEEMLFDHVGWDERVAGGERNLAGHAVNIKESCSGVVVRDNVFIDSSSHAVLGVPADLVATGNVFSGNAFAFTSTGQVELADNVIVDGSDIAEHPRSAGITFMTELDVRGSIHDNLVARAHTTGTAAVAIEQRDTLEYARNIVYDWAPDPLSSTGPFVDPARSLASFDASIGGPGTIEHLTTLLRAQSRASYDPSLRASAMRTHIREGFAAP